jgi:vitamin B12 transporter
LSVHLPGRPDSRVRASFGTALKEPTFYENFASGFATGNPDLDPERSRSWEVGAEHAFGDLVRFRVTYFDQSLRDLIQYTFTPPQPGGPNFYNVAGATSRGVEAGVEGRWRFLEAGASYTWLDTEVTNSGFDDGPAAELVDGERLLRRPTHTIAVRAAASVGGRGRVHAALRRVGSRADRSFDPVTFAAAREELPGYSVWSVGGEWLVLPRGGGSPSVSVSLRGENLLDESYEEAWGFAAPGRRILLGLTLGLGGS